MKPNGEHTSQLVKLTKIGNQSKGESRNAN